MKLEIVRIADRGVKEKERLHLSVLADTSLVYYIIFNSVYAEYDEKEKKGRVFRIPKYAYWFSDYKVKKGDNIILYTGSGKDHPVELKDGITNHFFYWNLETPIWTDKKDCAMLFETNAWETSTYGE